MGRPRGGRRGGKGGRDEGKERDEKGEDGKNKDNNENGKYGHDDYGKGRWQDDGKDKDNKGRWQDDGKDKDNKGRNDGKGRWPDEGKDNNDKGKDGDNKGRNDGKGRRDSDGGRGGQWNEDDNNWGNGRWEGRRGRRDRRDRNKDDDGEKGDRGKNSGGKGRRDRENRDREREDWGAGGGDHKGNQSKSGGGKGSSGPMQMGRMHDQKQRQQSMHQQNSKGSAAPAPWSRNLDQQAIVPANSAVANVGKGVNSSVVAVMQQQGLNKSLLHAPKKPFVFLRPKQYNVLFGEVPSDIPPIRIQKIMEQCGPILAFRRPQGKHFAFCQFSNAEAVWKATICFSGKKLPGSSKNMIVVPCDETKVTLEEWKKEQSESVRQKMNPDLSQAEIDWELEKLTIMTQAAVDEKLKELYEWITYGHTPSEKLLEEEKKRVTREEARLSRRQAEMQAEIFPLQRAEKRRRLEEAKSDNSDRQLEAQENAMPELERKAYLRAKESKSIQDAKVWRKLLRYVATEMTQEEIFATSLHRDVDQEEFRESLLLEDKARAWLDKSFSKWLGGPQPELVEYTLRKIKERVEPEVLIQDLCKTLDEPDTKTIIERLWRMILFELKRIGLIPVEPFLKE